MKDLRDHLIRLLSWEDAHVSYDTAVKGIPQKLLGAKADGMPYTIWQLVEHMRITQHDILDFCRNSDYEEMNWPDDYWPSKPAPRDAKAWAKSLASFRADRRALEKMVAAKKFDPFAEIPHGSGQTYLREVLLVADHTAYHVGEVVAVRRALDAWK